MLDKANQINNPNCAPKILKRPFSIQVITNDSHKEMQKASFHIESRLMEVKPVLFFILLLPRSHLIDRVLPPTFKGSSSID